MRKKVLLITDKFREYKKLLAEAENAPEPDPATEPKEYMEYRRKNRRAERSVSAARDALRSQEYTLDQVLHALGKAGGMEAVQAAIDLKNERDFQIYLHVNIQKIHPELAETLSPEEKKAFRHGGEERKQIYDRWIREGKISEKDMELVHTRYVIARTATMDGFREEDFVEALEETLTDAQREGFTKKILAYKDPLDYAEDEKVTYPYRDKTQELKQNIPADMPQEQREAYTAALDYAAENLTEGKEPFRAELQETEKDAQKIEARKGKRVKDVMIPEFEGGKYADMFDQDPIFKQTLYVNPEKEDAFNDLINGRAQISETTREGVRRMLDKMEKMKLHEYSAAENGEDGVKVYGFNRLLFEKETLEKALKKGDPREIIKAQQAYKKTKEDYEELFQIAKEHFKQEEGIMPGNLDSIRNASIPIEFAGDLKSSAQLNVIFLLHMQIQKGGLDKEAFLENPVGAIMKDAILKWNERSFRAKTAGASLEECVEMISGVGAASKADDSFDSVIPAYGFGRMFGVTFQLERDPKLAEENQMYSEILVKQIYAEDVRNHEASKFKYFGPVRRVDEVLHHNYIQTLSNLMLASDEERDMNTMLVGRPKTDFLGRITGDSFDPDSYIAKKPVDYAGILERAERLYKKVDVMNKGDSKLDTKLVTEAQQQLFMQVLMAHPEDADLPGQKKMRQALDKVYDRIAQTHSEDAAELAAENKKIKEELLEENILNYRIENDPVRFLRGLEEQAVRSGDYKDYAKNFAEVLGREDNLRQEIRDQLEIYANEVFEKHDDGTYGKGEKFFAKFSEAVNDLNMREVFEYSKQSDEIAKRIRSGEVAVEPVFEDLKTDYHTSRILANRILDGMPQDKRLIGYQNIQNRLSDMSQKYEDGQVVFLADYREQRKKFLKSADIGENEAERTRYVNDGLLGYTKSLVEFNVKRDAKREITALDPIEVRNTLQKSAESTMEYYQQFQEIRYDAGEQLKQLKELKNYKNKNSDEFVKMYDALENVTKLSAADEPQKIEQTIRELKNASEAYTEKIDNQWFAKGNTNGQLRYEMAVALVNFADEKTQDLTAIANGRVAKDGSLFAQMQAAEDHLEQYKQKQRQLHQEPEQHRRINMNELVGGQNNGPREDAHQRMQERRSLQAEKKAEKLDGSEAPIRRTQTGI